MKIPTEKEALHEAQDLMWTAFDTASKSKRIELAKRALSMSPDCADAYVILACDQGSTRQEKIELYEEGVKAGQRALGIRYFKEDVGCFWGILETRPYMRARFGLAVQLHKSGRIEEAIAHYRELLRLNGHSDNQGVRYHLAPLLLSLDRLKEAAKLLNEYPDDVGPELNYTHALLLFKQSGDSKQAQAALQEAARYNPHVLSYLLTPKLPLRIKSSEYVVCGGKEEAFYYAKDWRKTWHDTKGAVNWLVENLLTGWIANHHLYVSTKKEIDLKI